MADRRGHVVVIGDALIDEIHDDAGVRDVVGGAALNVAVGLTRLGVPTTLIAMLADDADGAAVRAFLERYGVRLVATAAPRGTARAVATKTDGEARYTFNDAAVHRAIEFDGAAREALDAAPLVVVSCYPFDRDDLTEALLDAVADPAERLVVDPNPRPALMSDLPAFVRNLDRVAAAVRLIKIGDEDAALLYGADLADAAAAAAAATAPGWCSARPAGTARACSSPRAGSTCPWPTCRARSSTRSARATPPSRPSPTPCCTATGTAAATPCSGRRALQNAMIIAAATCRSEGALLQLP